MSFSNFIGQTNEMVLEFQPLNLGYDQILNTQFSSFCQNACLLLNHEKYSEILMLIEENRSVIKSSLFDIIKALVRKLNILLLVSNCMLDQAFLQVTLLKEYYDETKINFTQYYNSLFRLIEIPGFSKSALYQSMIQQVISKLKHLILYEDYFIVDFENIIHFEKEFIKVDEADCCVELSVTTTDSSYTQKKSFKKYRIIKNLKQVNFLTIKREKVNRMLTRLLVNVIKKNLPDKHHRIGSSQYQLKEKTYKSCSNDYIAELFSLSEAKKLYESKIVQNAEQIQRKLVEYYKLKNSNDINLLSWYIRNMHKIFAI